MDRIKALSVLDGRYAAYTAELADLFSEFGLIRHRVVVEVHWLRFLFSELKFEHLKKADLKKISAIASAFDEDAALAVKKIEKKTNHDVKAVEYYLKERLTEMGLGRLKEWVHFGCTSEDINNAAYALMLKSGRDIVAKHLLAMIEKIESLARAYKGIPMISRTHGQPATPTTVGKEFVNFAWRLRLEYTTLRILHIHAKMNGASGNFNAHHFVFPEIDWIKAAERFISDYLGVTPILYTTQINPNSHISEMMHVLMRIAAIMIDLDRDLWGYIAFGYFRQEPVPGEVGSSTMPHKVNPIDFENSEGNMGLAISVMAHLSVKLLNSRFQRDLSDSTVLRNLGALLGYLLIGLKSTLKGLNKISVDREAVRKDIQANPEVLAEAIQTAMRVYKEETPYERLKGLTRGKRASLEDIGGFIDGLDNIPAAFRKNMKNLTVEQYTGLAEKLVDHYLKGLPT